MNGENCKLIRYMDGASRRFIIPVYQRNYDWKIEHCRRLYDDLVKVVEQRRKSHFFGSIVSVYNDGKYAEHLVIDGQQRLTTISLMFLAIHNLIMEGKLKSNDQSLAERVFESFLVDKYSKDDKRIKLKPVKNDQKAFESLFGEEKEYIRDSNITINYNYFYERIQEEEITVDDIFDSISRLEIINITLNNEDDPQLIFESLNSTGLDLSEGDKIRNFILMGISNELQENYYEKYWNKIEEYTKYDVSTFIRDYLSVKQQEIPSQKKVYVLFKEFVYSSKKDIKDILEDILVYAKRYSILLSANSQDKQLDMCIYRLNRLETTVTRPFFLEILRIYDEGNISLEQMKEVFIYTENYIFRRLICGLPTNALNKIFLKLHKEVVKYDNTINNYLEKFKYTLSSKRESARFPNDKEFVNKFSEYLVYPMKAKNKIYILEKIENGGTIEDKNIYEHFDEGRYSIEHIMPQKLTKEWIKDLGPDFENIHQTWLHRIANLTLTAYNSKYSNSSFKEKKNMDNGLKDSGIRMNTYIVQNDKWTLNEIEKRNSYLMEKSKNIWKYPITKFNPKLKEYENYTLEEYDQIYSGREIFKYTYKNIEQNVNNWTDMFKAVLQEIYKSDKSIIMKLANDKTLGLSNNFSMDPKYFKRSTEIGDGIYVLTNSNTQSKLSVLQKIFKLYDIDLNDLVMYIQD